MSLRADLGQRFRRRRLSADQAFLTTAGVVLVVTAQITQPGTPAEFGLLTLGALALAAQPGLVERWPELAIVAVSLPVLVAIGHRGRLEVGLFMVVLAILHAAQKVSSPARATALAGGAGIATISVASIWPERYSWPPWFAAELFMLVLGRTLHRQAVLIADLDHARGALAETAVAEERRRIAREVHDLAGHTLAAMLLHVTGARHVLRRDLDDAERALIEAEAVGRSGLEQIRATVAALRTTERGVDPSLPGGAELVALVGDYRRAGLTVAAAISPEVAELSGPVAVALHRIGGEALANVARHAPTQRIELEANVTSDGQRARLRVQDRGRRPPPVRTDGFGLLGMRERARALGGAIEAGPTSDGWVVTVEIPLGLGAAVRPGDSPDRRSAARRHDPRHVADGAAES